MAVPGLRWILQLEKFSGRLPLQGRIREILFSPLRHWGKSLRRMVLYTPDPCREIWLLSTQKTAVSYGSLPAEDLLSAVPLLWTEPCIGAQVTPILASEFPITNCMPSPLPEDTESESSYSKGLHDGAGVNS